MTDWDFVNACQSAAKSITEAQEAIEPDDDLDQIEAASLFVMIMAAHELNDKLDSDDGHDDFKWDDDHTFK